MLLQAVLNDQPGEFIQAQRRLALQEDVGQVFQIAFVNDESLCPVGGRLCLALDGGTLLMNYDGSL